MRIKRTVLAMLILVLCVFVGACSGSDSGSKKSSEKKSDKNTSSASDKNDSDDGKSAIMDLLNGDKKDANPDSKEDEKPDSDDKTDVSGQSDKNDPDDEKGKEDLDASYGDKDTSKSDRHIDHKYFELVTVNGYTREQILADEDLAADLAMWDFLEYGTGVEVSFDYDNGYIQYTWYAVSPNAYSSAPIDNPSATDYMQDYTDFLNMGEQPEWIPISVRYSDDTITLTFTEGGATHVYKLRE